MAVVAPSSLGCSRARTPSPVSPRLVRTPDASHPLPKGARDEEVGGDARRFLAQQVGTQHGPAAIPVSFDGRLVRAQQPLQTVTVHQGPHGRGGILGVDAPELLFFDTQFHDFDVALMTIVKEVLQWRARSPARLAAEA